MMTRTDSSESNAFDAHINASRSRFALAATALCDGHPMSSALRNDLHEYPHPKAYKARSVHFIENRLQFEELTGAVLSYHHRFRDPMAFNNRYKKVIDRQPDVFRKVKSTEEIGSSNRDMFGKEKVLPDVSVSQRMENISRRSSSRRTRTTSTIRPTGSAQESSCCSPSSSSAFR